MKKYLKRRKEKGRGKKEQGKEERKDGGKERNLQGMQLKQLETNKEIEL